MTSTSDDFLQRFEIKKQAQFDLWERNTSAGSWLVWPAWFIGLIVGNSVFIINGLWWNVKRGYNRVMTHPWTIDQTVSDVVDDKITNERISIIRE